METASAEKHLRVCGVHSKVMRGLHAYEFYISPEGNRKAVRALSGRLSFSLPLEAFLPKARDAIHSDYERNAHYCQGEMKPLVRLGMIDFRVVEAYGRNVAFALNYKPKGEIRDPIQIESRKTGMGGYLEALCLKDLRRTAGATHTTATAGVYNHLSAASELADEIGPEGTFIDSEARLGQLRKCGIDPIEISGIGGWIRRISRLSEENRFAARLLAKSTGKHRALAGMRSYR